MDNKFNRLANHFSNYWKDKDIQIPSINFDVKAIERYAEEKQREDLDSAEAGNIKSKPEVKSKEKDLGIIGLLTDTDDMIEKVIENKVKNIINRIIDEKLRASLSNDLAVFEKSMSQKVQGKVESLKSKILSALKTVAPDVGKDKDSSKDKPLNFTDSVFKDNDNKKDVFNKESAIEVYPDIIVKANKQNTGDIFIKQASKYIKMNYTVDLPETNSKSEYIKQLKVNIQTLIK